MSNTPPGREAENCDASISPEIHLQSLSHFLYTLPMAVARSSSGSIIVDYYFRFLDDSHV